MLPASATDTHTDVHRQMGLLQPQRSWVDPGDTYHLPGNQVVTVTLKEALSTGEFVPKRGRQPRSRGGNVAEIWS